MPGDQRDGVFLSYARQDGEKFAANLRQKLRAFAPDIVIKQDRLFLEGGIGFWKQIQKAIDSVEFLLLVMTPAAIASAMVQKEWRYARQQGVCIYPVKGAPDSALRFADLPRWMGKAHFFDIEQEWENFLAHLRKGCDTQRVPFMAPDLPDNFVQRPHEFERLKNHLLSPGRKEPVAITTALSGAGGFGKTTLAAALCHDEDIVESFDDGILWVTLGQQPNVMNGLVTLYAALSGERPGFAGEDDAAFQLGQKLGDRACLLVIDDVWDAAHLRPFLRVGRGCARLFTTRDTEIASEVRRVEVDEMRESESVALLTSGIPGLDNKSARELSRRLGEWPIAIELARATMRQRIDYGDSAKHAAERLFKVLDEKGVRMLKKDVAEPRFRTIDSVLQASLDLLSPSERQRLAELSIFPHDIAIPLSAMATLWGLDELDSEETSQKLAQLSLLKLDLAHGTIRLHDVMRMLLAGAVNAPELHDRLVQGWLDWLRLPDDYAWRWLPWHLAQAGRRTDLERILWDPSWLQAKLGATEVNSLIVDFEHLRPTHDAELMQYALRLSAHILAHDKNQLWGQLAGRLPRDEPRLTAIVQNFPRTRTSLVPVTPTLAQPGQPLLRTLTGHTDAVAAIEIYAEGRRAISTSNDKTLKVWDPETGDELRTLTGHADWVNAVAVYAEGQRAISASADKTLKIWDLETGVVLRTLTGHTGSVNAVAVYAEGRRAVSGSYDKTLKVWDLETGAELRTLRGHAASVNAVTADSSGRRAVSASVDKTLKVWDPETGEETSTLIGHIGWVVAVAICPDGRRAISASWDSTLKLWDLETRAELRTLCGHKHWVTAVAVYAAGRRAISASADGTLKIWDLETGAVLRALSGHTNSVNAVAVYAEGRRALSGSGDGTLKAWDIETAAVAPAGHGHTEWIRAVTAYADGQRAISASADAFLKVWDVGTASECRTLPGHTNRVNTVAVYAGGRRAISASDDNTLRVWDLETGAECHILRGHSGPVNAVAVYGRGQRAISASADCTLKLWDLETGTESRTLTGHTNRVNAVVVYAEDKRAISASHDYTLRVWDLDTGAECWILSGHANAVTAVVVYAEGRRALSASWDNTLKVWDLERGIECNTLSGHADPVTAVAVYDRGRRAISASGGITIKTWDLERGSELRTLAGHAGSVAAVAVFPCSRRAVSASGDKTLRLWDLDTGEPIALFSSDGAISACAIANETIIAGDQFGAVHFLHLIEPDQPVKPISDK